MSNNPLSKLICCGATLLLLTAGFAVGANPIHVSPRGNDKNAGTLKHPLRTLTAALLQAASENECDTVTILLHGGRYELARTVEIGESQTRSPLLIRPYENDRVTLSGGRQIPVKNLRPVSDPAVIASLQPQVRTHVREIDLHALGITAADLHPVGFGRPSSPAWTELFLNGQPLTLARWPNDSTVLIGEVLEPGTGEHIPNAVLPVFRYQEERPAAWFGGRDFWIGGYFAHGYADDMVPVSRIDTTQKTIHVGRQTTYGFMSGAPWRQWYAVNLLQELDLPGEYVLDAANGKIYVYPRAEPVTELHISVLDQPLLAIENCSRVTVENIVFEYGRSMGIYLENTEGVIVRGCTLRNLGGVGISVGRGSYTPDSVARRQHAAATGGEQTSRVVGDLLGKVYEDILFDRRAGRRNGIIDCQIYQVGAGGISLGGGDRRTLTPADNYVENCRIHDFNRIEKSYRPGIWIDGVGNRVSKCDIYNAPSMAILFHGNDHLIELCRITNVCSEVDDQGAIYYGRDPSELGNVIRYCYFHELSPRHRVTATYHDDGACGAEVYGNIYHRAGSLPVLIGGGHDNHYRHNIFMESPVAIHLDNRMQHWGANMVAPQGIIAQRLDTVRHTEPPYSTAYPELARYWLEDPAYPHGNLFEGNLFYRIGNVLSGRTEWGEFRGNWITRSDPGFVNPDDPLQGFLPNAEIFQRIPGFPRIPFEDIGCSLPE